MDGAAYGRPSRRGAIKTGSELEIHKKDVRLTVRKGLDCKTWDCKTFDSKTFDSKTFDSKTFDSKTFDSKTLDRKTFNDSAYRGCAKRGREGSRVWNLWIAVNDAAYRRRSI